MTVTKIKPEIVLINIILWKPTPIVPSTIDDDSAKNPISGNTMIAKTKQILKLFKALPSGFLLGSTKPE